MKFKEALEQIAHWDAMVNNAGDYWCPVAILREMEDGYYGGEEALERECYVNGDFSGFLNDESLCLGRDEGWERAYGYFNLLGEFCKKEEE